MAFQGDFIPIRYRIPGVILKIKKSTSLYQHLFCVCAQADGYVGKLFTLKLVRRGLPRLCTSFYICTYVIVFIKRNPKFYEYILWVPKNLPPSEVCAVVCAHPSVLWACMVLSSLGAYVSPYGQSFATLVVLNVFGLPNKKKLKGVSAEEKKKRPG